MIKAVAFRIVVRPDPIETKTKSGIVLATDEKQEVRATVSGTIVDIGEDAWKAFKTTSEFAGLKVGDHVVYARYAGKWVKDPETHEEFLVMNDEDIICKC
mgnify:CR=1 FL=1